jgi:hypothetical protein
MLTAEQTYVAREAFEARRRRLTVELNKRMERAPKKERDRLGPFEPRLERDPGGDYLDGHRQFEWSVWCETWEAALASVGIAGAGAR